MKEEWRALRREGEGRRKNSRYKKIGRKSRKGWKELRRRK